MEQILDQFIAVALVFLLLGLIVKGIQDLLKHLVDNKEQAMKAILKEFTEPMPWLKDLVDSLQTRFGQRKAKFLEHFTAEQFRAILEGVEPQGIQALTKDLKLTAPEVAKDFAAQQFANALRAFQARYERNMSASVFLLSLFVVAICNANIIPIYQDIAANAVTRQSLVALAQERYREAVETVEGESPGELGSALQERRREIEEILSEAPILMRGVVGGRLDLYEQDFKKHGMLMIPGLLFSAFLVYLGAPFWHDLLQSLLSAKNVLRRRA